MSSFLEFRHQAFVIPFGLVAHSFELLSRLQGLKSPDYAPGYGGTDFYLAFVEGGDSNVFDMDNRVAREWRVLLAGSDFDCIQEVCHVAANYVHGGMACLRTRRHFTKPENYIRKYREVLANAASYERLADALIGQKIQLYSNGEFHEAIVERLGHHPWTRTVREEGRLGRALESFTFSDDRDELLLDLAWLCRCFQHQGKTLFSLHQQKHALKNCLHDAPLPKYFAGLDAKAS